MRRFCFVTAWVLALAGCWQVAGIDVIDLPERDGQSDDDGLDADADAPEQEPDEQAETTPDPPPPDLPEDPPVEDVPPDLPPTGMSAEDFCNGLKEAYCYYFGECCSAEELGLIEAYFVSCEGGADDPFYNECAGRYGAMVTSGSLRLDEDAFWRCSEYIMQAGTQCLGLTAFLQTATLALETTCREVFIGLVDLGGECTDRVQCAADACCFDGRCTACLSGGQACWDNEQCPAGLRCIESACHDISLEGGSCDLEDEMVLSDCGSLYWCKENQCSQLLAQDEPCPDISALNYGCSGLCYFAGACTSFCGSLPSTD